jgi:hypothetical protein
MGQTEAVTAKPAGPPPGPDDLAPGWRSSGYTIEGRLRQLSMLTSNVGRRRRGWRGRMGGIAAIIVLVLILAPAGAAVLQWLASRP